MRHIFGNSLNGVLGRFGYRIVNKRSVHDENGFVERVRRAGFAPKTIVDVGVAYGTPYLYNAFPQAKFHLFDPTRESLPHMEKWAASLDACIHNFALGDKEDTLQIITRDTIIHATLLQDTTKPNIKETYDVPVRRFDSIGIAIEEPALCKIDVEGFELPVLQGMGDAIRRFEFIIVECSLASVYSGGADSFQVQAYMASKHYRVIDIVGVTRRPADDMIHQIDYCFVRLDSKFAERKWA